MAAMSKKKKRERIGTAVYWSFLLIYIALLVAASCYGLSKVWTYAEEYEASRPNNTIDAYIEDLNKNFWNSTMSETIANMAHEVQSDEECKEFVQSLLDGGITYARTSGTDPSKLTYTLKCENGVIGKVTLAEDKSYEDKVEFGMLPWKVDSDEFDFNGLYSSVKVTVPATYSVMLNGVVLGPEYIIEDGIHMDLLDAYYGDYPNLPTKVTYKFSNIIGTLEPVILNEEGEETVIDETQGDAQYITFADDYTVERLTDFVTRFEQRYRKYASGLGAEQVNYEALLGYIIKDSDLDYRLQAASDGLSWSHTSAFEIESTTVENVIQIDNNTWIVRETTIATAYGPKTETSENTVELIIVEKSPDDLRVIAMTAV